MPKNMFFQLFRVMCARYKQKDPSTRRLPRHRIFRWNTTKQIKEGNHYHWIAVVSCILLLNICVSGLINWQHYLIAA